MHLLTFIFIHRHVMPLFNTYNIWQKNCHLTFNEEVKNKNKKRLFKLVVM